MDKKDIILNIENVSIEFDNEIIIKDLNLKLYKNQFISIVGKSGTGKSSILNAIANFVEYSGNIYKKDISFVFQNQSNFPWKTVYENLNIISNDKDKNIEFLNKINLLTHKDKYPYELSGGQNQRLAIAKAYIRNHSLILMDEPFSSLDYLTRIEMQNWLLDFKRENNSTVIFVTHNIEEAILLSDKIFMLRNKGLIEIDKNISKEDILKMF